MATKMIVVVKESDKHFSECVKSNGGCTIDPDGTAEPCDEYGRIAQHEADSTSNILEFLNRNEKGGKA